MIRKLKSLFLKILYMIILILTVSLSNGCGSSDNNNLLQTSLSMDQTEIIRAGFIGQQAGFIYYTNYEDDGKLYRIRTNGHDNTKILDVSGHFLDIADGWIYYTGEYYDGCMLYRIKTDGSQKEQVSRQNLYSASMNGNYIYYLNNIDTADVDAMELFRMKTDGTEITRLASGVKEPISFGNWIFYINPVDNKIYKTTVNAIGSTKICDDTVDNMFLSDNQIYFIGGSDNYSLHRIRTDGTNVEKIADIPERSTILNVFENHIYYEDGRKGIFCIEADNGTNKLVCYTWDIPIKNWRAWGIDPDRTGMDIENLGGFVPLYKALDYISNYEMPGYRLAGSYGSDLTAEIRDIMDPGQVEGLKNNFDDILYAYPSGYYIKDKLIQGRLILGVRDTRDKSLGDMLNYLAENLKIRPTIAVFTTLEDGIGIRINSIGYITDKEHYLQRFGEDYSYGYDIDLSAQLSSIVNIREEGENNPVDDAEKSAVDEMQSIYVNGFYSGNKDIYAADIGVYLTERLSREEMEKVINSAAEGISNKDSSPWLNIVLFYCSKTSGDLMDREILAVGNRFPADKDIKILYEAGYNQ